MWILHPLYVSRALLHELLFSYHSPSLLPFLLHICMCILCTITYIVYIRKSPMSILCLTPCMLFSSHSPFYLSCRPCPCLTPWSHAQPFSDRQTLSRSLLSAGIPLWLTRNMELKGIPHEEGRRQLDNGQHGNLPRQAGKRANMTAAC